MKLDELIEKAKAKKEKINTSETISVTVRISKELNSTVLELAEHLLDTSKQKMLEAIIEEGVSKIVKEFSIEEIEKTDENPKIRTFHLLNTNKRHDERDGQRMCNEGIASAFYGDWKKEIDKIKKNDVVFLYENGVGIIAFGVADGKVKIEDKNGDKNEMHYQKLSSFIKLKEPYKASKIKNTLNRNFVFLKTKTVIHDGEILFNELQKIANI
jgi:hypothetical protein